MRILKAFVFVLFAVVAAACGGDGLNCNSTAVGPSCVNGKVDRNNPLPGPGEGVRASVQSWGVYEGDCPDDPGRCTRKLEPTDDPALQLPGREKTFVLKRYEQKHTVQLCVVHPEVPGRKLSLSASGFRTYAQTGVFDEAEPGRKSPVCVAAVFDLMFPNGTSTNTTGGDVHFYESSQDLFTPTEWRVLLGFRICVTPEGYQCSL